MEIGKPYWFIWDIYWSFGQPLAVVYRKLRRVNSFFFFTLVYICRCMQGWTTLVIFFLHLCFLTGWKNLLQAGLMMNFKIQMIQINDFTIYYKVNKTGTYYMTIAFQNVNHTMVGCTYVRWVDQAAARESRYPGRAPLGLHCLSPTFHNIFGGENLLGAKSFPWVYILENRPQYSIAWFYVHRFCTDCYNGLLWGTVFYFLTEALLGWWWFRQAWWTLANWTSQLTTTGGLDAR